MKDAPNPNKIVVFSGAGLSQASGLPTFRDSLGLWQQYDVLQLASPIGFAKNPELVHQFYQERRLRAHQAKPNAAHLAIAALEQHYDVVIVTQNVDDLHERGGSTKIIHLHGELRKVRGEYSEDELIHWEDDVELGHKNHLGEQLRPAIVWFGEAVPEIERSIPVVEQADILVVIGTSLQVYPAAGLLHYAKPHIPVYYIDPKPATIYDLPNPLEIIALSATEGMEKLRDLLIR